MRPEGFDDPAALVRGFTIRASDYVAGVFGASLQAIAAREAPQVTLRFADQGKEDVMALREGRIDLDIGVLGDIGPEIRHTDAVARSFRRGGAATDIPLLKGKMNAARFASARPCRARRDAV